MTIQLPILLAAAKLGLICLVVLGLCAEFRPGAAARAARYSRRSLLFIACIGVWAFSNFGFFHGPGSSALHVADMYHYYLGSKYIEELGYDGLYAATFEADEQSATPAFREVRHARDLQSANIVAADLLRNRSELRGRFSDERWAAFRRDLKFFEPLAPLPVWQRALRDHGYNAPPTRTVVTATLENALGAANWLSVGFIALLDPLCLALMIGVVYATYGLRTAVLLTLLMGGNVLSGFEWIGGAHLRYSWLVLSVIGVCALKRDRYLLAGVLLGCASLFRIFPAFLAGGVVLYCIVEAFQTREWKATYSRYLTGLALSAALLVLPSLVFFGGIEGWQAYFAKISLHLVGSHGNHIGLSALVEGNSAALWTGRALIAGAFVLSMRQVNASQAAILGGVLIFAFGYVASYYYCLLILFCLWDELPVAKLKSAVRCVVLFAIPGVSAVLILVSTVAVPSYDKRVYVAASLACIAACGMLFWDLLGGPVRVALVGTQLASRRWSAVATQWVRIRMIPWALPLRSVLTNSVIKLVVPRPKL